MRTRALRIAHKHEGSIEEGEERRNPLMGQLTDGRTEKLGMSRRREETVEMMRNTWIKSRRTYLERLSRVVMREKQIIIRRKKKVLPTSLRRSTYSWWYSKYKKEINETMISKKIYGVLNVNENIMKMSKINTSKIQNAPQIFPKFPNELYPVNRCSILEAL